MAHKILVVEDEALLGQSVQEVLEESGFVTEWARDANETWHKLEEMGKVDLVLLDIMLPGGEDGYGILRRLKMNNSEYKETLVIMMTNLGQIGEMDRAMELGADDYIIKANIDLDRLVDLVKEKLAIVKAKR